MTQSTIRDFADSPPPPGPNRVWSIGSATASLAAIVLSVITFLVYHDDIGRGVLFFAIAILCVVAVSHARFLYLAREQYRQSNDRFLSKEREFQSIFENALDAILVLDGKGVCQDANPSACELLGARRDRIVRQPVRLFYSDPHNFDSMWERLLASHRNQGEA